MNGSTGSICQITSDIKSIASEKRNASEQVAKYLLRLNRPRSTSFVAIASASGALDTETCELCRELPPLPKPEPELVFREREQGWKAPLIRAGEVALLLRE